MKKFLALTLAAMMLMALYVPISAADPVLVLNAEDLYDALDISSNAAVETELNEENGTQYITFTVEGNNDPWLLFSPSLDVGVENHYALVKYRTTNQDMTRIDFYPIGAEPHATSEELTCDGEWHYTVADLTKPFPAGDSLWNGSLWRFDMMAGNGMDWYIDIEYIAFFSDINDAAQYAGTTVEGLTADYDESSVVGSEFQQIYWNGVKFNNYEGGETPLAALKTILNGDGRVDDAGGSGASLGLEGWVGFDKEIVEFGAVVNDTISWSKDFDKGSDSAITAADKGGQNAKYYKVDVDITKMTGYYSIGVAAKLADGTVVKLNSKANEELNTFILFIGPSGSNDPQDLNIETGDNVDKVPGPIIFFTDESEYTNFIIGANDIPEIEWDDELGCLMVTLEDSPDPYFTFAFPSIIEAEEMEDISADDYKVISLGIRHNSTSVNKGQFFYGTTEYPGYSEPMSVHLTYQTSTDYQPVYVDLRDAEYWTGDIGNCRLDPLYSSIPHCDFEVYYIAFFKTMAGAVEFGENWANAKNTGTEMQPYATATAKPATAAPTDAPATDVPTNVPATDVPATDAATDVPATAVVTEAAAADPTNGAENEKTSSGGLPVGAIIGIIVGVVAVAAVIAGIIISKKKK